MKLVVNDVRGQMVGALNLQDVYVLLNYKNWKTDLYWATEGAKNPPKGQELQSESPLNIQK